MGRPSCRARYQEVLKALKGGMMLKVVSELELDFRRNEGERHITLGLENG
jgi:hypothetical protein